MAPRGAPLLLLFPALLLPACCNCGPRRQPLSKKHPTTLPAPISLDQQIHQLNDRARKMPMLSAAAPIGGVVVFYLDDKGKSHREALDGHLWIRQHFNANPPSADVALFGTVANQTVLDAGANHSDWWCILNADPKRAWTGKISPGRSPDTDSPAANAVLLRADKVLDVLAITLIRPTPQLQVTMHPSDDDSANILLFTRCPPGGQPCIERELTVDRATGLPTDVRLFAPDSTLLVRAHLDTYRDVSYDNPAAAPKHDPPPMMPHHIIVEYPAAKSSVELHFSNVSVPKSIRDAAFETRDWQDLNITPQVVN
ncbi:MAG TPA: hypothetical protein VH253_09720 [Phycisphaerae bacterium]|nr:hypothetical protein [Phycisphaerae bacterium]